LFIRSVAGNVETNAHDALAESVSVSRLAMAEALRNNMQWPFVTLSSFEIHAKHTNSRTSAETVIICPFITERNLDQWSNYSVAHQGWIEEGLKSQDDYNNTTFLNDQITPNVYHIEVNDDGNHDIINDRDACCNDGYPIMPVWQMSPAPSRSHIVNYNLMSIQHYRDIYDAVLLFRGPVVGKASPSNPLTEDALNKASKAENHRSLHAHTVELDDDGLNTHSLNDETSESASSFPHSSLTYPIFENFREANSTVVGLVFSVIPWDSYVKKILPVGVTGVYCVLQNSCGQVYTYVMRGPRVILLGEGDQHDSKFDGFKVDVDITNIMGIDHKSPFGEDCLFWMSFYPSNELRALDQTKTPQLFAMVVGFSFVIMAATFALYDYSVLQKNDKIMHAAAKSNAIVSVRALHIG
jgi:hypothetical protein